MSASRVYVVTGSNKGIGFYIVKQLCQKANTNDIIYLTSRNTQLGLDAVKELEKDDLKPRYHQLDIADKSSISNLCTHLKKEHNGLDVLVNNAAIAYKGDSTAPFEEQAEVTVGVNFFDTLSLCDALFPILKTNGRVVTVSSMVNRFSWAKLNKQVKSRFTDPSLTMDSLENLMREFIDSAKSQQVEEKGFAKSAYGMSKVGITFATALQQQILDKEEAQRNIVINCMCPGYCDTDMTSHRGPRHPNVGASVATYLAMLPPGWSGAKGKFWENKNKQQQEEEPSVTQYPPADQ